MTGVPVRVAPGWPDLGRLEPGGSAWWYADLTDASGNGMVVIVAVGLPFLPGYSSAARRGLRPDPHEATSIVWSTVRAGRPDFYVLERVSGLRSKADAWEWDGGALSVHRTGARCALEITASGFLPGCAWRARLEVEGVARMPAAGEPDAAAHEWTVWTAGARGRGVVDAGDDTFGVEGRAYVDRNLSETGVEGRWCWGHVASGDDELVWYVDDAGGQALRIDAGGTTEVLDPPRVSGRRRGWWGQPRPSLVTLGGLQATLADTVDDGPFYTRVLVRDPAGKVVGVAEACDADRIDRAWSRPLVRMVVAGGGSPWLPLFSGPRSGRVARLLAHAAGRS